MPLGVLPEGTEGIKDEFAQLQNEKEQMQSIDQEKCKDELMNQLPSFRELFKGDEANLVLTQLIEDFGSDDFVPKKSLLQLERGI